MSPARLPPPPGEARPPCRHALGGWRKAEMVWSLPCGPRPQPLYAAQRRRRPPVGRRGTPRHGGGERRALRRRHPGQGSSGRRKVCVPARLPRVARTRPPSGGALRRAPGAPGRRGTASLPARAAISATVVGISRPERLAQAIALAQHPIPAALWSALQTVQPDTEDLAER